MSAPTLRLPGLPPIRISAGTLITIAVVAFLVAPTFADQGSTAQILLALGVAAMLIVSVALHEIAHALSARLSGADVEQIALTLFGGHTTFRSEHTSAGASALISLAGPVTNLLLGAGLALAAGAVDATDGIYRLLSLSSTLNYALGVFNLLPGLPMDGGRVVEGLIGAVTKRPTLGTRVTAWIGRGIAVLVVAGVLLRMVASPGTFSVILLVWGAFLASMLWRGASEALTQSAMDARIARLHLEDLMQRVHALPADAPLRTLANADAGRVVILDARRGAGFVDDDAMRSVPSDQWDSTPLGAVTSWVGAPGTVPVGISGRDLVHTMLRQQLPVYLITARGREVVGVVTTAEMNRYLRGR